HQIILIYYQCTSLPSRHFYLRSSRYHTPHMLYALSLHDALPISTIIFRTRIPSMAISSFDFSSYFLPMCLSYLNTAELFWWNWRSEEHTSELQSRFALVCRLLLDK